MVDPEGMAGQMAAQVLEEKGARRQVFRNRTEVWEMDGMTITGQRINGRVLKHR